MIERLAKWLTRKPRLVALAAVIMLIPAAIGYISTRINYDILSYLPEDLESSQGEKLLEEPFKMAATSMLIVENMPAGYTNSLINDIKAIDGVSNAIWISNLMGIQIPTDMIPANFRAARRGVNAHLTLCAKHLRKPFQGLGIAFALRHIRRAV